MGCYVLFSRYLGNLAPDTTFNTHFKRSTHHRPDSPFILHSPESDDAKNSRRRRCDSGVPCCGNDEGFVSGTRTTIKTMRVHRFDSFILIKLDLCWPLEGWDFSYLSTSLSDMDVRI